MSVFQSTQFLVKLYCCFPQPGYPPCLTGDAEGEAAPLSTSNSSLLCCEKCGVVSGRRGHTGTFTIYFRTTEPFKIAYKNCFRRHLSATHGSQFFVCKKLPAQGPGWEDDSCPAVSEKILTNIYKLVSEKWGGGGGRTTNIWLKNKY